MSILRPVLQAVCLFCFLSCVSIPVLAFDDWLPISPEDLALKTPKIEPDAAAEALFWEVYVADEAMAGIQEQC